MQEPLHVPTNRSPGDRPPRCRMVWLPVFLLVARFLFGGTSARGQYDPQAPEPISPIRGSLFLVGSGPVASSTWFGFFDLVDKTVRGESPPRFVVIPAGSGIEARAEARRRWETKLEGGWEMAVVPVFSDPAVDFVALGPLRRADVVWIEDRELEALTERVGRGPVRRELVSLLDRGGVLGASGAAASLLAEELVGEDSSPGSSQSGLGLFPGVLMEVRSAGNPLPSLSSLAGRLPADRGLVGVELPSGAALSLRRRFLRNCGQAPIRFTLGPTSETSSTVFSLDSGRILDLISLSRREAARSLRPFPPSSRSVPKVSGPGTLLLGGGGRLSRETVTKFIERAGGPDAPILYVPCTSEESLEGEPAWVGVLRRLGAKNVGVFHTKDRTRADSDPGFLAPLDEARGIWFGGGRQWNFVDSYQHTLAHQLFSEVLARGGVIGGSSAGASIQGEYLARGDPLGNRNIIALGYEEGLGFLPGVAIDQHFSERGRESDLRSLVETYPQYLGIGIDEGTALWVQGTTATVEGKGKAFFFFYEESGSTQNGDSIRRTSLGHGERFDLEKRTVLRP